MRSTARIEKEFSGRVKEESKEALWQRCTWGSMFTRIRLVYKRSSSIIPNM